MCLSGSALLRRFHHGSKAWSYGDWSNPALFSYWLLNLGFLTSLIIRYSLDTFCANYLRGIASKLQIAKTYSYSKFSYRPEQHLPQPPIFPAKPFITRACWICYISPSSDPRTTTPELQLCLLHSLRALPRQRQGIPRLKEEPMAGTRAAGIGTCHRSSLYPRPHSNRSIMHESNNCAPLGHVLAQMALRRPFVDRRSQQISLSKKKAVNLIIMLRLRAPTSMFPHT